MSKLIFITGPESTGKTELAKGLAKYYKKMWVPEFAREYVEKNGGNYTFNDVELIAKRQTAQINKAMHSDEVTFFDTGLIITKIWFEVVYNRVPDWLNGIMQQMPASLHLLCNTDLEWQADAVRENGGEMRNVLFERYKAELHAYNWPYSIISGTGKERLQNAIDAIAEAPSSIALNL